MQVHVLLFGMLKDLAGKTHEQMELRDDATVDELLDEYAARDQKLASCFSSLAVAVNQQYAGRETVLKEGDEVALLPPVSGGSQSGDHSDSNRSASRRASIVREPIATQQVLEGMKRGEDGSAVVFEGVVRNQTRGRRTLYLDYEAYEAMALQQLEELIDRALRQFPVRDAAIVHRLGKLQIGEISVLIVVVSAHRAAAFDACRWLIDTLKKTVPIWKKEHFEDGAVWADGEPFPEEISGRGSAAQGSPGRENASK
ncbi:MAG TPA: molybdopterin converting factor subunit 1 [Candidatus Binatia bacterium]|nr:molybdopterin converting factor subunit 1 [Candidatus Binatia bacterium]